MSTGEGGYEKRVQASIPAELKEQIRLLVETDTYDSEAEVVRAALRQLIESAPQPAAEPAPLALTAAPQTGLTAEQHRDLKERLDLVAWLMTVGLLLMATIASRILQALTHEKAEPMQLVEQALTSSVDERDRARRKLAAGWRAFKQSGRQP